MTVSLYSCVCNFFFQRIKLISPSVFTSLYTFLWVNSELPKQRSAAGFKRKVLSGTLCCTPIHYTVQNGSNF